MLCCLPYFVDLMGYNETKMSVSASLSQMNVSYLDLVMIHHRAADVADWPRSEPHMDAFPNNSISWMREDAMGRASWEIPPCAQVSSESALPCLLSFTILLCNI